MRVPHRRPRWQAVVSLALFALGYLGVPVLDGAMLHAGHAARPDLAHVDDGTQADGHRCVLDEAFQPAGVPLAVAAPAAAAVPAGVAATAPSRPLDRRPVGAFHSRAPPPA